MEEVTDRAKDHEKRSTQGQNKGGSKKIQIENGLRWGGTRRQ